MILSDDRISHILHLILDGLEREGIATFKNRETAVREGRKVFFDHFKKLDAASETARKKILSLKTPPPENSPQWENLYQKYYEEELNRRS